MDTGAVLTEIETALKTIGLRTVVWGARTVSVPAAVVNLPAGVEFHATYGVGSTVIDDLTIVVMVGRADARSAVKNLMPYVKETGGSSVKALLEGYTFTTLDVMTVKSVEFEAVLFGDVPYLAAVFHSHIVGRGAV